METSKTKKETTKEEDSDEKDLKPKPTFVSEEKAEEHGTNLTGDQDNASAHDFDDLTKEKNMDEDDIKSENQTDGHNIPHLSSLNSHIPSSGVYSSSGSGRATGSNKLHILILIVIGIVVIGATVYLLRGTFKLGSSGSNATPQVSSSPTPTPTPTPTPIAIDRSKFKIRVLNGSGKSGLAASVSSKLKDLGYQIERTGNATNSAFEVTQVRAKDSAVDLIAQLILDLAPDFKAASSSSSLKSSDTSDGEVILGLQ